MFAISQWSPLFVGLAVLLLAWLLVAGRRDPRRAAFLVSLVAALALLVELAVFFVNLQFPGQVGQNAVALDLIDVIFRVAVAVASLLGYAAWTLLLANAARDSSRVRLIVLAIVFALALMLESALGYREPPPLEQLREALLRLGSVGGVLLLTMQDNTIVAALVVALLAPAGPLQSPGAADAPNQAAP